MNLINVAVNLVDSLEPNKIGAKITNKDKFLDFLEGQINLYDFTVEDPQEDIVKGMRFIPLSEEALSFASGGVGLHTNNPDDYVVREYCGSVRHFLRREFAAPAISGYAVIYTREEYSKEYNSSIDPMRKLEDDSHPYVLQSVLVFCTKVEPVSLDEFVADLAKGSEEYSQEKTTVAELIEKAERIKAFHDKWCIVAD